MKLSIVVPAYNEEEAIAGVVRNCLEARARITSQSPVREVEVIVVNDGSSDSTAQVVSSFPEARLITHERNSGYGAALKTGFRHATGDLLAFLDGDGTCDADDFAPMCADLVSKNADMVVRTRLGTESQMPKIRRFGNRMFAMLARLSSGKRTTDIASGMRVFRRSFYEQLPPLPNGLHFTPGMTCHSLMLSEAVVVERPITYRERVGRSKLGIIKDGFRFLKLILDIALVYRPLRMVGSIGLLCLLIAVGYGIFPVAHYLNHRRLEEWMIFRLMSVATMVTVGLTLLNVGLVGQKIVGLARGHKTGLLHRTAIQHWAIFIGGAIVLSGIGLNIPTIYEYARYRTVSVHWSYVLTGGLLVIVGAQVAAFGILNRLIDLLAREKR